MTLREQFEKEFKYIDKREFPMFLSIKYIQWLEAKIEKLQGAKNTELEEKTDIERCSCVRDGGIDKDVENIVNALNAAGIQTIASCCGHTFQPTSVIIKHNGVIKELRLFTFDQARKIDKLFPDINGDLGGKHDV